MSKKAAWKKFEASMKEKRTGTRGKDILIKQRLTVQRVSDQVSGAAQKYTRIGAREFVPYEYEELSIEKVREACMLHYETLLEMEIEFIECDVLAGEQGPSCSSFDELPNPDKVIYVRFIKTPTPADSAAMQTEKKKPENRRKKVKLTRETSSASGATLTE